MAENSYDVIIVGYGGAGACAAIEAADAGARVLVIDRAAGGGATAKSGGVIYLGGGTPVQRRAGLKDDPARMFRYLLKESRGELDRAALTAFCRGSAEQFRWLTQQGLKFSGSFYPHKTFQPPEGSALYFSGNEKQYDRLRALARGHIPDGGMMPGNILFAALKKSVASRGVEVRRFCRADELLVENGKVVGVRAHALSGFFLVRGLHWLCWQAGLISGLARSLARGIENCCGKKLELRARGGVILAGGGFIYNPAMLRQHAPAYARTMPLGTIADDGAAIRLGERAGAALASMECCAASRFYCPPEAFAGGALVNLRGARFTDESLYGATLSHAISLQPQAKAWLVVDQGIMDLARRQAAQDERLLGQPLKKILSGDSNALLFRKFNALVNRHLNRKKAASLAALAIKCGMDAAGLEKTIAAYNQGQARQRDPLGKLPHFCARLAQPPFYAIDCRLSNPIFLAPCLTLGGLKTQGLSGAVLDAGLRPIPGLFAAGRSGAGICQRSYVSGLSLSDCIFSGRRAGRSAAARAGLPRKRR